MAGVDELEEQGHAVLGQGQVVDLVDHFEVTEVAFVQLESALSLSLFFGTIGNASPV